MNDVVISVDRISKRYRIGQGAGHQYLALRDLLANTLKAPLRLLHGRGRNSRKPEYIWALRDVSLEVKQGEIVGLIGRNGAGKTTLLKILTRITKPTAGRAEVHGRVGSLLEVGTGFHPELTGRENVYLSGAILGMSREEIEKKFNEIVDFAGVGIFIDTPAKHYSSGMYTRLGFAVAAHLEPEVLLVDEVLAVGDLEFQKKCLGKMKEVSRGGRTVIFVSHQMNQIRRLCERVAWIDDGQIRMIGPTARVVGAYEGAMTSGEMARQQRTDARKAKARFLRWEIVEPRSGEPNILSSPGPLTVKFLVQVNEPVRMGVHGIALFNAEAQLLWGTAVNNLQLHPGRYEFIYTLPTLPIRPGAYHWRVSLYDETSLVDVWDCTPDVLVCTEPLTHPRDEWAGILNIPYQFSLNDSGN